MNESRGAAVPAARRLHYTPTHEQLREWTARMPNARRTV